MCARVSVRVYVCGVRVVGDGEVNNKELLL